MSRWRFACRRQIIVLSRPDADRDGTKELHRWRLIETPFGGIMLHRHVGADPGRVLLDHPWTFASFILRGGYTEQVAAARDAPGYARLADRFPDTCTHGVAYERRAGTVHVVRLDQAHRIIRLRRTPTWTLLVHGPRRRPWGFYPPDGFIDERAVSERGIDLVHARED